MTPLQELLTLYNSRYNRLEDNGLILILFVAIWAALYTNKTKEK